MIDRNEAVSLAVQWVFQSRGVELGYVSVEDLLRHNPNCCETIDPSTNNATNAAFGMPSRTSLVVQFLVPHYTIVVMHAQASPGDTRRVYNGAVAIDRCGQALRWSNGAVREQESAR